LAHDSFNVVHLAEVLSIVFAVLLKILQMEVMTFTVALSTDYFAFFHKNGELSLPLLSDFITFS